MSAEIFVSGDMDRAIKRLQKDFNQNVSRPLQAHSFFETRAQRRKRKDRLALKKKIKAQCRRRFRTNEARLRNDRRSVKVGSLRAGPEEA